MGWRSAVWRHSTRLGGFGAIRTGLTGRPGNCRPAPWAELPAAVNTSRHGISPLPFVVLGLRPFSCNWPVTTQQGSNISPPSLPEPWHRKLHWISFFRRKVCRFKLKSMLSGLRALSSEKDDRLGMGSFPAQIFVLKALSSGRPSVGSGCYCLLRPQGPALGGRRGSIPLLRLNPTPLIYSGQGHLAR